MIWVENLEVECLVDSGSDHHILREDFFEEVKHQIDRELVTHCVDRNLKGFGENSSKTRSFETVVLETKLDGVTASMTYWIVPKNFIDAKVLIGDPILDVAQVKLRKTGPLIEPIGEEYVRLIQSEISEDEMEKALENVPEDFIEEIRDIIFNYKPEKTEEVPVKMKIILKDEKPIVRPPARLSIKEEQEVQEQIEQWLKEGIIEESESEFAAQVVVARKKDNSARVCVNYKPLNKVTYRMHFPLPLMDDLIDEVEDTVIFIHLDLKSGFLHVKIEKGCRHFSAFRTKRGHWQFIYCPFGMSNGPHVFMKYIVWIFRELIKAGILIIYLDDILIKAKSYREAIERLKMVLELAAKYGLIFNWKKCRFLQKEIEFLGYIIGNGIIRPSPSRVADLMDMREPRNVKQVQRFLGLAGTFRKFIKDFASIARPLTELTKKDTKFHFGPQEMEAFATLKEKVTQDPVLKIFNPSWKTEVHTDASIDGFGAMLLQQDPTTKKWHLVACMSKKTKPYQRKWTSYHLEAYGVHLAVEKWRYYLFGRKFKIVTDCMAFELATKNENMPRKMVNVMATLEEYDYEMEHRPGEKMKAADCLSRKFSIMRVRDGFIERLVRAQERDDKLKAIRKILSQEAYEDFIIENGLLFKEINGEKKLVVPKGLQTEVIKQAHEKGHFAVKKTMDILQNEYWMKNMEKKVHGFIQNCIPCILGNRKRGKQEGKLNPIPKGDQPFHTIHMDHVGPLASTAKSYKHLLVLTDGFSKFTWIFATKSTGTQEVLDKLAIHQQNFGNPIRIVTDKGSGFTSNDFHQYCRDQNIEHHAITTGVPRANGQVEKLNGIIEGVFARISEEEPKKWYKRISRVQRALNGTYQRSIDATPFELLFGVKLREPEDEDLRDLIDKEIAERFSADRRELRENAREQIQKIQEENCKSYNKRRKEATKYRVGDLVAIRRSQMGPGLKLAIKFFGPYRVVKVKQNDRYSVEKADDAVEGPQKTSCAADGMKPWTGFADDLDDSDDDGLEGNEDDDDKEDGNENGGDHL